MRTIKSCFKYVLFLLLLVCFFSLGIKTYSNNETLVTKADDASPTLTISYDKEDDYAVWKKNSTYIYFTFKLNQAPTTDVVVVFHAEDRTAISAAGDYYYVTTDAANQTNAERATASHKRNTITLNSTNYKGVTISYYVGNSTYRSSYDSNWYFNYFILKIDEVNNASYSGNNEIKAKIRYTYTISMSKDANNQFYYSVFRTELLDQMTFTNVLYGEENAIWNTYGETLTGSNQTRNIQLGSSTYSNMNWYMNHMVYTGWGHLDIATICTSLTGNKKKEDDSWFFVKVLNKTTNWYDTFSSLGLNYYSGSDYSNTVVFNSLPGDFTTSVNNTFSYYDQISNQHTYGGLNSETLHRFFETTSNYSNKFDIQFNNEYGETERSAQFDILTRFSDTTDPSIDDTYLDTSSAAYDGKVRLMVRFSELVTAQNTSLIANINSYYKLNFKYKEGAGTNTLVYEASLDTEDIRNNSFSFKSVTIQSFSGTVYDLGYNWRESKVNTADMSFLTNEKVTGDLVYLLKPSIESCPSRNSSDITKTKEITVNLTNFREGYLYYCWSKEKNGNYATVADFTKLMNNDETQDYAGYYEFHLDKSDTSVKISSPQNLNGEYYLHLLCVSNFNKSDIATYGRVSGSSVIGGYLFDNTAPSLNIDKNIDFSEINKIYDLSITDEFNNSQITGTPSGLYSVGIKLYDASTPDCILDKVLWCPSENINKTKDNSVATNEGLNLNASIHFSIDKNTMMLQLNGVDFYQLNQNLYGTYYYYFYCIDNSYNTTLVSEPDYLIERYDTRETFSSSWEATSYANQLYQSYNGIATTGFAYQVFDINDLAGGTSFGIRFMDKETDFEGLKSDVINIYKIYYGPNKELVYERGKLGDLSDYVTIKQETSNQNKKFTDCIVKPKKAGYYAFELVLDRSLDSSSNISNLYTRDTYEFYFTDHSTNIDGEINFEDTTNYLTSLGNLVLTNKVFQINSNYYYLNSNDKVISEAYHNCNLPATFSSVASATEYVKYMEYQDLELQVLDTSMANFLNSSGGSTKYQKADGYDSTQAASGQTWIRYKRKSWTSDSELEGWAYYFYSNKAETTINIALINANCPVLVTAINTIVDNIIKSSKWVYLTEEEYFDQYNAPTLDEGQIHFEQESVTKSKNGYLYSSSLNFAGDSGLYLNTVTYDNINYPLATNMVLTVSEVTHLFYIKYNGYYYEITEFEAASGQTLKEAMGENVGTGVYKIIELDGNGLREFDVFVDEDAPLINISWYETGNNAKETKAFAELNVKNDGMVYSAKSMTISASINSYEEDSLAYVAVYTLPTYHLLSIYYYSDLATNPIEFDTGNYYCMVGDRSGNIYSFTVQVCSEELIATVKIIDNSYVIVETNRSEDQIERYEVTCNGVLQKETYNEKGVKYYNAGLYNVFIKDIYGYTNSSNGTFGEDCLFERESPQLNWYYQNDSGGYSQYIEGKTSVMSITQSIDSDILYINSSKLLKFTNNGDYDFEFPDLQQGTDYEISANKRNVNIITDKNWTMKVWYTSYPDVVTTYICTMDTSAPTINLTYKVNYYDLEEISDTSKAVSAPIGSTLFLNSLSYTTGDSTTKMIGEGDYVYTNLINCHIKDDSGVDSVAIYIDGVLWKEYSDLDGVFTGCTLSRNGTYLITTTDLLGNKTSISFSNCATKDANIQIDNTNCDKSTSKTYYGHDTYTLSLQKEGYVYFKVNNYSLFYSYVDGCLVYTSYINTYVNGQKEYIPIEKTKTIINEQGEKEEVYDAFFNINSDYYAVNKKYEFVANNDDVKEYSDYLELDGIHFYVYYDENKTIYFEFISDDLNETTNNNDSIRLEIEALCFFDYYEEPYYFKACLSKELTNVTFTDENTNKINTVHDMIARTNGEFSIASSDKLTDVDTIKVSYSTTREFMDYTTIYQDGEYCGYIDTCNNGFYDYIITNIFGNLTHYTIYRSDIFSVLSAATYDDYVVSHYDDEINDNLIKSNYKVSFEAYADFDEVNQFVLKNKNTNKEIELVGLYENGYYSFEFSDEGIYEFTLKDNFGNTTVRNFEIKKSSIDYQESYITGYNEKALLLNEGYTNQCLSINLSEAMSNDIGYISIVTSTESMVNNYKVVTEVEKIIYDNLTQNGVGKDSKYAFVITRTYTYYEEGVATLSKYEEHIEDLLTGALLDSNDKNKTLMKNNTDLTTKFDGIVGKDGDQVYSVHFRNSYGAISQKTIHYQSTPTLTIYKQTRTDNTRYIVDLDEAIYNGLWSNSQIIFETNSKKFSCTKETNGTEEVITEMPVLFAFTAESGIGTFIYALDYCDEYGNNYHFDIHLVRQELVVYLGEGMETMMIDNVETTRNNITLSYSTSAYCTYRLNSGDEQVYNKGETLYRDGTYRFIFYDYAGNTLTRVIKKDTVCDFSFFVSSTEKTLINGDVVNSGTVKFEPQNNDPCEIVTIYHNNEEYITDQTMFSKDGKWSFLIQDTIGNITLFEFYIITHEMSSFSYTTPINYKITECWYNSGDGVLIDSMELIDQAELTSSFDIQTDGIYTIVMQSLLTDNLIDFSFTIDTSVPLVTLEGCNEGERTVNSITLDGVKKGDTIEIYKDGELTETIEIEDKTDIPTITEGGKYKIVVTNAAGVSTTLEFTRTYVPNTAGSALIIIFSLLLMSGILIGIILRNRQKVDD